MEVFVKSYATYRTIKKATAVDYSVVLDALESETSTVTVAGSVVNRSDIGNWLIFDSSVYQISNVKPETDRTILTLAFPLDAFNVPIEFEEQPVGQTIGGFIAQTLQQKWVSADDPVYAAPYLDVSNLGTIPYVPPDLDSSGCFKLPDYCRLVRKSYRTTVHFADAGKKLQCVISRQPVEQRKISFEDGRSRLQSADYSYSGTAKLTVLHDVETGEKDSNGEKIYRRERSTWYLSEDGEVGQLIPARRAPGKWDTLYVKGSQNVEEKVVEAFAKNKANHKIEFWSDLDLNVQADCTFVVYGELLQSYISYKRKSRDNRLFYKSGELATTVTEKLRGAIK